MDPFHRATHVPMRIPAIDDQVRPLGGDGPALSAPSAPQWWLPLLTLLPALLLPVPLLAVWRDVLYRRPGAVPVSLLFIPLWLIPSGLATAISVVVTSEEDFFDSTHGKINIAAWVLVLAPLALYLLSVGLRNFLAIVINPFVPRKWRVKHA